MVLGVGGSDFAAELARMAPMTAGAAPIGVPEYEARIAKAQALMRAQGVDALYLDASSTLRYFTGIDLSPSERLHGAIIPARGAIAYLSPAFEAPKLRAMCRIGGDVRCWEEHEDPAALAIATIGAPGTVALDPATPFAIVDALRQAGPACRFMTAAPITVACRQVKSPAELALMQIAMDVTLAVHQAAARCLAPGMAAAALADFIDEAHRRLGGVPAFKAVQFGAATAYPHGVPGKQVLADGDMVLVDAGCLVEGYRSDITRTYIYGTPTERQRAIWALEQRAQRAGFAAATLGAACAAVDEAARGEIVAAGFGPGYAVPGLPHRTGHGIGTDLHEEPYIVRGNATTLEPGMCFSIEPMICLYGEFGVRLEDIVMMTDTGPRWFTQPCRSVDDPFGLATTPVRPRSAG